MITKVYTTPSCPWCKRTKDYLREKGVSFEEIDITKDQDAARVVLEKTGQLGVPVTDIDGQPIIGFDKEAIDKALAAPNQGVEE